MRFSRKWNTKSNYIADMARNCTFLTADIRKYLRNVKDSKDEKTISIEVSVNDLQAWHTALYFIGTDLDNLEDIIMMLITKDVKEVKE